MEILLNKKLKELLKLKLNLYQNLKIFIDWHRVILKLCAKNIKLDLINI